MNRVGSRFFDCLLVPGKAKREKARNHMFRDGKMFSFMSLF